MKNIYLLVLCLYSIIGFSQIIALQSFATGFSSPTDIAHPVNDSRLFVVQQAGLIRILNSNGTINPTPFINLASVISTGNERGLLGLAFHPNYATNGLFFVNYTNTAGNTVIARYSVSANPDVANTTGIILMTISQPFSNHNGGNIEFGPDGYLYIGMGDGGSGGDPNGYSQNLTVDTTNPSRVYLGKMLRIDVDTVFGLLNYGFPATNPFISEAGKEEIWANGLRNPWKFSFNRLNGDLWIADVGQNAVEEIDKIPSPLPNTGLNFGWRCYEGNATYNSAGCVGMSAITMPVAQYTHASTAGCSITGGFYYTGSMYPNFTNKYFFADYCTGKIGYSNAANTITWSPTFSANFTTFGEDINGELYIADAASGIIYKLKDATLSTSEFELNGFSLYPNPANKEFFIKNDNHTALLNVQIFDLSGKLLLTKKLETTLENSISVSNLSFGMYLVTVETANGKRFNTKLVVN
jgi:glucose/arabinose dehydrogenase